MNIGVCGTGTIASWVSDILGQLNDPKIVKYGVASSFKEECQGFQEKWNYKKTYDSYDEMMSNPDIDLVYIAVPNNFHKELCLMALEHGKNVVVEKPFAINDKEAEEMIEKAKEKDLFLAEALWPAYLPSRKLIDECIASGKIGQVTGGKIIGDSNVMFLERVKRLDLGGGSLLDMGPYALGRVTSHFGTDIKNLKGTFELLDTGVDARDQYIIEMADGAKIECISSINAEEEAEWGEIYGTEGTIHFDSVANPSMLEIRNPEGKVTEKISCPDLIHGAEFGFISGYEHEWIAFEKAIREGKKETKEAPLSQTLAIARALTELRKQAGVKFPFE